MFTAWSTLWLNTLARARACACVCVHVRARARVCARVCVRARMCVCVWIRYALQLQHSQLTGMHITIHFQPTIPTVSKAPVMHEYKKLKSYFQNNIINGHINMLTDWRKLSFCIAPNSQVLVMESTASLSWQLSVQYQQNGTRQLPSHPVSSQFLRTVTKRRDNYIKTSDHTRSKTWTLRNYLCNIHMHVVTFWWHLAILWWHQLFFLSPVNSFSTSADNTLWTKKCFHEM